MTAFHRIIYHKKRLIEKVKRFFRKSKKIFGKIMAKFLRNQNAAPSMRLSTVSPINEPTDPAQNHQHKRKL